jgi:SAM-dependent methyltransferase
VTTSKDPAFQFFHEVVGLDDLHYGLWNGEALTIENLKAAQRRYTSELLDWIDSSVETVLDVGCGYGGNASAMRDRGLKVTGLTPDPDQKAAFEDLTGFPCYQSSYEDLEPDRSFDLILMSQSCHHVPLPELFQVTKQATPGGYLLATDYFVIKRDGTRATRIGHLVDRFRGTAVEEGFDVLREADITDEVLPTLDFVKEIVDERIIPTLQIARQAALRKHPLVTRSLLWLFRRKIGQLEERRRYVDRDDFVKHKRYMRYLFRVPGQTQ